MNRPNCTACNQRLCAINYTRDGITHYRSRCDACIKKGRRIRAPEPRWASTGYKKKPTCDRCGFRAKYSMQLMVYHVDSNLNNSSLRNLKTVCQNCAVEIKKLDLTWRPGDLEPDF
jgi:hypothetical protein